MNEKISSTTCDKIVKNAIGLFNQKGYDGTSISDISKASGVSKGILYHYFMNKDALYLHCVAHFMETAYAHIKSQTVAGKDVDALAMEIVNYGGFFEKYPHYTYIFLNMLNGKPDHLSKELDVYCRDFKEKNRSCFADFIQSLDLGRGVTKCDVENFLSLMQNVGAPTISSFVSENPDENQRAIMARLIRIFLQGLQSDIT